MEGPKGKKGCETGLRIRKEAKIFTDLVLENLFGRSRQESRLKQRIEMEFRRNRERLPWDQVS